MPGLSRLVTRTRSPPTLAARSATWVVVATTRSPGPPVSRSPPDPEQPAASTATRQAASSPARRRPMAPPSVRVVAAIVPLLAMILITGSAAALTEAAQLQPVVGDGEAGAGGDRVQQRGQAGVDLWGDGVVLDPPAAAADQVMVVADQLLGQLVAGVPAPGPGVAGDRPGLLEHDQVAVDGADRQPPGCPGQLDDLQRPPGLVQQLDQGPTPGRVPLLGTPEPRRH